MPSYRVPLLGCDFRCLGRGTLKGVRAPERLTEVRHSRARDDFLSEQDAIHEDDAVLEHPLRGGATSECEGRYERHACRDQQYPTRCSLGRTRSSRPMPFESRSDPSIDYRGEVRRGRIDTIDIPELAIQGGFWK
ncbi:MAG TPA: hypothetical protein VF295_05265 [Candidatus Limnocylindria bacterium]